MKKITKVFNLFQNFVKSNVFGSAVLITTTAIALLWANSQFTDLYHHLVESEFSINLFASNINLSLHLIVNDGLMVFFFFLVALEIKREILIGELSEFQKAILPIIGAIGGVLVPTLIYFIFNFGTPNVKGWAIPMATDIAFALGILALLGYKVPLGLKIFLTALAIADDLVAIIVIAVFYSSSINYLLLLIIFGLIILMQILKHFKIETSVFYLLIGLIIWYLMLNSGVHATIAGVITAFIMPITNLKKKKSKEILNSISHIEHKLSKIVAYFIMPLFALVNSGVIIKNISIEQLTSNVSLGIFFGLFFGKAFGVFSFVYIFVKLKIAKLSEGINFNQMFGVSILCGIGFTMSIFVSNLSFQNNSEILNLAKTTVIIASIISALSGYLVLKKTLD